MLLQDRIDVYLAQNGSESRLTFRQERRLRKAANKQAKARRASESAAENAQAAFELSCTPYPDEPANWEMLNALESVDTSETWQESLSEASEPPPFVSLCPTCNVTEGPCLTKSGKPARTNHKGREAAA